MRRPGRFYRWHAPVYDATRRPFLPDRQDAVRALGLRPGERVIDWACGTGAQLPALLATGARVVGVDLSEDMLARARRRAPEAEFVVGDVRHARPDPADAALCTYGLSLIPDWREALRNMHAALRPGGRLLILDFHRPQGGWRLAEPALAAWFGAFGVERAQPVGEELSARFDRVRTEVRRAGWNALTLAEGARF